MKRNAFILLSLALLILSSEMEAQCAMCKAVVEDASENVDAAIGKGINSGIIYIMFLPWALLLTAALVFFKDRIRLLFKQS